jgi:hypothetical protein
MTYYHHQQTGQILDEEDGQIIATMSESATPEQAELLAAAPGMFAALQWFDEQMRDDSALDMGKLINEMEQRTRAAIKEVSP